MHLLPHERDKLLVSSAGLLAQHRLSRGLRLSRVEAIALISHVLLEFIRDGENSVAELMNRGRQVLGRRQVMDGVESMLQEIQIEGTFVDGTKLVTIHQPINREDGNLELALYASQLQLPALHLFDTTKEGRRKGDMIDEPPTKQQRTESQPLLDCFLLARHTPALLLHPLNSPIAININRSVVQLRVINTSDRPVQVGSHFHFIETNRHLKFDRLAAYGCRLDIAAATGVRFEPGEAKTVRLCEIGGNRVATGGNRVANGKIDRSADNLRHIQHTLIERQFCDQPSNASLQPNNKPTLLSREKYAQLYGPTTGDLLFLADTGLCVRIEHDSCVYGDECKFGGGKSIRESQAQKNVIDAAVVERVADLVICNVVIIDYTGIYKSDLAIKSGFIVGIGKAGNDDTMDHVNPSMLIGANTDIIDGSGLICTAGAIDSHIHFISPQLVEQALHSGVTTLIGGGVGPSSGTLATTCTPSPLTIRMMLQALDECPVNVGLTGKGNSAFPLELEKQIEAGCCGLKLHEDWGSTHAAIDCCLSVCDRYDVQVTIHTDTLNESANVEDTISSIAGRTIHAYHTEGAGGGHSPDLLRVCGESNVIPSSTNPTKPSTINTVDEHLDMLMVCHHLNRNLPEDISFAESRIRQETIVAEDVLHDIGAISIISSDSAAMGRAGETITRCWQTASKMKQQRGHLNDDESVERLTTRTLSTVEAATASSTAVLSASSFTDDNFRVRRFISKYTINPARAHGIAYLVGSLEVGKLADLCLWKPALFGSRPELVMKSGIIVVAQMGDANASIPTPQPSYSRAMFGSFGQAAAHASYAFVSAASIAQPDKHINTYQLKKRIAAVKGCRIVKKTDMAFNSTTPVMKVDPETFQVHANGELMTCEPIKQVSLGQTYSLF